jgi:hypothetical protein
MQRVKLTILICFHVYVVCLRIFNSGVVEKTGFIGVLSIAARI